MGGQGQGLSGGAGVQGGLLGTCSCAWWGACADAIRALGARHALDIREHYERKLERANNLYMELSALMLQLELKEKELLR